MHPGAYARESALTQERIIEAAKKIGAALGIPAEFPMLRVNGDMNQIKVSALNQRRAVADFLESISGALEKPEPHAEKKVKK